MTCLSPCRTALLLLRWLRPWTWCWAWVWGWAWAWEWAWAWGGAMPVAAHSLWLRLGRLLLLVLCEPAAAAAPVVAATSP